MNHTRDPLEPLHALREAAGAGIDPVGVVSPLFHAACAWLAHPHELGAQMARLWTESLSLQAYSWRRLMGGGGVDPVRPHADDSRFADPAWREKVAWDLIKEWYLFTTRATQDMLYDTPGLSGKERRRAAFWSRKWLNAVAPTNFFWTNPVAIRNCVDTRGGSLFRGFLNFLEDMKAGEVRMTSPGDFAVGVNLATTTGAVVFRNHLLEVIQYEPARPKVHETPIVIVTPWINKFYILDLNPQKSMVRFLLEQGFSVFITSWKNPTPQMRDVRFDDYLLDGIDAILRVAREITGAGKVHAVGYCIGGTALSIYMAWANRRVSSPEDVPVAHWTLFTTLVDFHKPGDIEVFIDRESLHYLDQVMAARGYLDGKEMAAAFRLLRSNSLIWHYVVHGYLYGEKPRPFDVLYWNMDTTRMPYAMHDWYLRELYLGNQLIRPDALNLGGQPIDLGRITQPLYAVSAADDHIAPWRQTYRISRLVKASVRYVLSSSGHILGIVNPPVSPPRRSYRVAMTERHENADQWHARAEEVRGSWWEDWVSWLGERCGPLVDPPGKPDRYPALAAAPGTYVLEK